MRGHWSPLPEKINNEQQKNRGAKRGPVFGGASALRFTRSLPFTSPVRPLKRRARIANPCHLPFRHHRLQHDLADGFHELSEPHARIARSHFAVFPRLRERRSQIAGTLSGGEAQMLAIGRGLLSSPRYLMLDEPSLGIAPLVRGTIFETIQMIYRERGISILLVEQNARSALKMSQRAYVLENGELKLEGSGAKLIDDPYVKEAYLGY